MANNTEYVKSEIASIMQLTEHQDLIKFGHSEYEFIDQIATLIQQEANRQKAELLDELEAELDRQNVAAAKNLHYQENITKNQNLVREWKGTLFGIELIRPAIEAVRKQLKRDSDDLNISLCKNCHCMTKTVDGKCGKCKEDKSE